jgi:hypothetical protein
MKIILTVLICFCFQVSFSQKLDINSLEKLLNASVRAADTLLKNSHFTLSDKEIAKGYSNYYYTSYEKQDLGKQLLRSVSFMDVYDGADTSRLVLYRTYYEDEQEELRKQLLTNGYELVSSTGNNFIYKKGDQKITNKIALKTAKGSKPVTAYEFELGR